MNYFSYLYFYSACAYMCLGNTKQNKGRKLFFYSSLLVSLQNIYNYNFDNPLAKNTKIQPKKTREKEK